MTHTLHRPARRAGVALAAALVLACASAAAAPLDDIRRQVEAGQFDQAYLTAQANPQLIGDVHFDFLYGVAAINVGRVPEGLLALERHLAAVPANDRARLELARGYFLLGEYPRARSEFEFVLRYNPPQAVREKINGFLLAMQLRETNDRRATARGYAEFGLGYDDNVNAGTYHDELNVASGNVSLVGSTSRQVPDSFAQVAIGGQQTYRVTNRLSVFAGVDLDHRANFTYREFNLTNGSLNMGFTQLSGAALWRVTLGLNELLVGGNRYRDLFSLGVDANYTLGAEQLMTVFALYGERRHAAADEVRNSRIENLGGMFTQNWSEAPLAPSLGVRASYTQEDNTKLRVDLSNKTGLLRLFGSISPIDRMRLSFGLNFYRQRYGGDDIAFSTVRQDDAASVDFIANYAIDARLSVRAELAWAEIRSNQDLYDSKRGSAALKLRYQF